MNHFQNPEFLFILIPVFIVIFWRILLLFRYSELFPRQSIQWDYLKSKNPTDWTGILRIMIREIFPYVRYIAVGFLILAASGPGKKKELLPDEKMGIDIMLALDISGSMVKSRDFLPKTRLDVSKILLEEFVNKRSQDRIGLVVFAGGAYLQSPLTADRTALKEIIREMDTSTIEEQGTAIGDAILLSTYRLKSEYTKSKIIILLTDGVSNTGRIDPETATMTARAFQIKIYSIGIGKDDGDYEVNFSSLEKISQETGGEFFEAETPSQLEMVLERIDQLEKDLVQYKPIEFIESEFQIYLFWAILLFILDWGGRSFVFRYYP